MNLNHCNYNSNTRGIKLKIFLSLILLSFILNIGLSLEFESALTEEHLSLEYQMTEEIQKYNEETGDWEDTYPFRIENKNKEKIDDGIYNIEINFSKTSFGQLIYNDIQDKEKNIEEYYKDSRLIKEKFYRFREEKISLKEYKRLRNKFEEIPLRINRVKDYDVKKIPDRISKKSSETNKSSKMLKETNKTLEIEVEVLDTEKPVKASWGLGENSISFTLEETLEEFKGSSNYGNTFGFTNKTLFTTPNTEEDDYYWIISYEKEEWSIKEKNKLETYPVYSLDTTLDGEVIVGMYSVHPTDVRSRKNLRVFEAPELERKSSYVYNKHVNFLSSGKNLFVGGNAIISDSDDYLFLSENPEISIKNKWNYSEMGDKDSILVIDELEISPNDSLVVFWRSEEFLSIWETEEHTRISEWGERSGFPEMPGHWDIKGIEFSPDNRYLSIGSHVLDSKNNYAEIAEFEEYGKPSWSPNQKYLAFSDGDIHIHETQNWTKIKTIEDGGEKIKWSEEGKYIVNEKGNVYKKLDFNSKTLDPKNITNESAELYGDLDTDKETEKEAYFYWKKENSNWKNISLGTIKESKRFNQTIKELDPDTHYEFYSKIKEKQGNTSNYDKGKIKSFRTKNNPGEWRKETQKDWEYWSDHNNFIEIEDGFLTTNKISSLVFNETKVSIKNITGINNTFSTSFWIRFQDNKSEQEIIQIDSEEGKTKKNLRIKNGKLKLYLNTEGELENKSIKIESSGIKKDEWQHIVTSINENKTKIYIDNELKKTEKINNSYIDLLNVSKLTLGGSNQNKSYFKGRIDDVRTYKFSLNKENIEDLYKYRYFPIGNESLFWTMEKIKNNTVHDKSNMNNHGNISNFQKTHLEDINIGTWFSRTWDTNYKEKSKLKDFKINISNNEKNETSNKTHNSSFKNKFKVRLGVDKSNNTKIDFWSNWKNLSKGENILNQENFDLPNGNHYKVEYWLESEHNSSVVNEHTLIFEIEEDETSPPDSGGGSGGSSGGSGSISPIEIPSEEDDEEENESFEENKTIEEKWEKEYEELAETKEHKSEINIISPSEKENKSFKFKARIINDENCFVRINNGLWENPERKENIIRKRYSNMEEGEHSIEVQCSRSHRKKYFKVIENISMRKEPIKDFSKEEKNLTGSYLDLRSNKYFYFIFLGLMTSSLIVFLIRKKGLKTHSFLS